MYKKGTKVIITRSYQQGAIEYVGQEGKIININPRTFAYCVQFPDGDFWFYTFYQLAKA